MHMPKEGIRSGFIQVDDGVQVHWKVIGQGIPLVCCNGVGVSTFFWKYVSERFKDQFQILMWDYRGHGLSQRDFGNGPTNLSIERHAEDLFQVFNHVFPNNQPAVMIGHSMGCQVIVEFHKRHPELVRGLVLMLGTAGKALETFGGNPRSPQIFSIIRRAMHKFGPKMNEVVRPLLRSPLAWQFTKKLGLVDPLYMSKEDFLPYFEHLASMDVLLFLDAAWECQVHDAWETLPKIEVPLLFIAAEYDGFMPLNCAKDLVAKVPGGELLVLAEGSHAALIEQPQTINQRLNRFFEEKIFVSLHSQSVQP